MFPQYNKENPELLESIVCFADILGFSDLIKSTNSKEAAIQILKKLHNDLNIFYKNLEDLNPYGSIKTFTDNIILAYPKYEDGEGQYGSLINSFMYFQLSMVLKGYFVRGGVALNEYYGDQTFAYGPALIEAYELESTKANYPRIILSDKMIQLIIDHIADYYGGVGAPQISEILCDKEDNLCFINYLLVIEDEFQDDRNFSRYLELITSHKEQIEKAIRGNLNNPKIMMKYSWLAKYHNYFCDTFVAPKLKLGELEDYLVNGLSSGNFSTILERVEKYTNC